MLFSNKLLTLTLILTAAAQVSAMEEIGTTPEIEARTSLCAAVTSPNEQFAPFFELQKSKLAHKASGEEMTQLEIEIKEGLKSIQANLPIDMNKLYFNMQETQRYTEMKKQQNALSIHITETHEENKHLVPLLFSYYAENPDNAEITNLVATLYGIESITASAESMSIKATNNSATTISSGEETDKN